MVWSCPSVGTYGLATYLDFTRANGDFLYRPTESGLDIIGDITIGSWVYFDTESTGVETGIISKWVTAGNQRSFLLHKSAGNVITFSVSDDGTVVYSVNDSGENYVTSQWYFVAGKLTVSGELALFVNGVWYINKTNVPASIYVSTADLYIASYDGGNFLDGGMCHALICAYAVPDEFICALYAHSKAMFMPMTSYARVCIRSSSSPSASISSSASASPSTSSSTSPSASPSAPP